MKKLLALLLALVMVFALAACDDKKKSSDTEEEETKAEEVKEEKKEDNKDQDDKEDKEEEKEEDKEDAKKDEDDADVEGEWAMSVDVVEFFNEGVLSSMGDVEIDLPTDELLYTLSFEFDGEELTLSGEIDTDSFEKYMKKFNQALVDYLYDMAEENGMSKSDFDAKMQEEEGVTVEEYVEESMAEATEAAAEAMDKSVSMFYKVDTKKDRIYVAEDEGDLDDSEIYIEFSLSGKTLTLEKFVEDGEEYDDPFEFGEAIELPYKLKKQ